MFISVAIGAIDKMDENETRITETTTASIRLNAKQEFKFQANETMVAIYLLMMIMIYLQV